MQQRQWLPGEAGGWAGWGFPKASPGSWAGWGRGQPGASPRPRKQFLERDKFHFTKWGKSVFANRKANLMRRPLI